MRVVISVQVDGVLRSVVSAAMLVKPGVPTTVEISAGVYVETSPLSFDSSHTNYDVEFVALGDGLPTITTDQKSPLRINSAKEARIVFRGLKIDSRDELAPAVLILGGQPSFQHCTLQSIHVDGDAAPLIEDCTITDSRSNGISVCGKAGGRYIGNTIKYCPLYGIMIDSASANILVANSQVSLVGEGCLAICGSQSSPTIQQCILEDAKQTVSKYGDADESAKNVKPLVVSDQRAYVPSSHPDIRAAVVIANNATPTLIGNTIFRSQSHGVVAFRVWTPAKIVNAWTIALQAAPTPKKRKGTLSAIVTLPQGPSNEISRSPQFQQSQIRDNCGYGILLLDGASLESEGDTVERNELGGVMVAARSSLQMKNGTVGGSREAFGVTVCGGRSVLHAVQVSDSLSCVVAEMDAEVECSGLKLKEAECGILSRSRAVVSLKSSIVTKCEKGISIESFATCRAEDSTIESNEIGIAASCHGIPEIRRCVIRRNQIAVNTGTSARGDVTTCTIEDSTGACQIFCSSFSSTFFDSNYIQNTNGIAVTCRDAARPTLDNNTFKNSRGPAVVVVGAFCDPTFCSNKFNGCSKPENVVDGNIVVIEEHGVGTFTNNTFADAISGSAIVLRRGACTTVSHNIFLNNRVGILADSGSEGFFEKNEISSSFEANVRVQGHDEIFAVPTFARNTISKCPIGIDCCENSNPLLSRNLVCMNAIGVLCRKQSCAVVSGNDIARNQCGILVHGRGTCGTFFGNVIRENTVVGAELLQETNVTFCENSFLGHFSGNDEFEGASLPTEAAARSTSKTKIRICALRIAEDCFGTVVSNRFAFNDIGIEFRSCANHTIVCSNVWTDNLCGLWIRTAKKESLLLGFSQSSQKRGELAPVAVCGGVFTNNGIGVATVGNVQLDVDFCVFHVNRLAGATVVGSLPDVVFSCCVFSHAGVNNIVVKGDPQQPNGEEELHPTTGDGTRRIENCIFFGVESAVVFQRQAQNLFVDDCIFVACPLLIQNGASPSVKGTHFTGSHVVVAVMAACSPTENVSFVVDPAAVSLLHASGGGKIRHYLPQVAVTKQLFAVDRAVAIEQAGGSLSNCFISFAKCGIVLDGTSTNCIVDNTTVSRCLNSGVLIGTSGFSGELKTLTVFRNYSAGVRVIGKCNASPAVDGCRITCHLAECMLDEPTCQQVAIKRISFPDNSDDRPFTGNEVNPRLISDLVNPPSYHCPQTDGTGVGVIIQGTGCATFTKCTISHSTVSNVVVESKIKSLFTDCNFHGAEGYGCVVRQGCGSDFSFCHFTSNFYAGVLNETGASPDFGHCSFVANFIGMLSSSDSAVLDESHFVRNKVCGLRSVSSSKCLLTRCTFSENVGCGLECRGGSPTVSFSIFQQNGSCGLLATSAAAAPNVEENLFSNNPIGMLFRASSRGSIKKNFICDNRIGVLCRMAADVRCSENTFQKNVVGVTAEWSATGTFEGNFFCDQRERSVSCTQGANPLFSSNIHSRDSPIVIAQQGRGTFTHGTYRFPLKHCFLISTAADPTISYSRFSLLRASDDDVERANKIQCRDPSKMKLPAAVDDCASTISRTTSSKFMRVHSNRTLSSSAFSFPTDDGPLTSQTQEPAEQEEVFASLTRRLSRTRDMKSQKMLRRASSVAPRRGSTASRLAAPSAAPAIASSQLNADLKDEGIELDYDGIPIRCEQGAFGTVANCVFSHNGPASIFCCGPGTSVFIVNNMFFDHRGCAVVIANDGGAIIRQNLFFRNALGLHLSHCDKRTRIERCTFYQNLTSVDATEGCCGAFTACRFLEDHLSIDCSENSETLVNNCEFHLCDYAVCGDSNIYLEVINCKFFRTVNGCFVFDSVVELDLEPQPDSSSASSILTERRRKRQNAKMIALTDLEVFGSQESVLITGANATLKMIRCKLINTSGSAILTPRLPLTGISRTVLGTTTITDCIIDGANAGVMAASNVRHRLVVQNSTFMSCEVGLESVTYESNVTVSGSTFTLCDTGLSIERGTAMIRHCEISSCRIGLSFSAGDERNPVICKSQIFDCTEIGCRLCEGACGVISLNDIFECGTCVDFEQDSTTELSHCVISHPSDVSTCLMRVSNAKRKPRVFDETLTLKQQFSPLHREKNQRQRAGEYATKRSEHDALVSRLSSACAGAQATIRTFIEKFLNGFGMTLAKLSTIPLHLQSDKSDIMLTPEPPLLEAHALPQRHTSFWKDDASLPTNITFVPEDQQAVPQALGAPSSVSAITLPKPVTAATVLEDIAKSNPQASSGEMVKIVRLAQHKTKGDDAGGTRRRLSCVTHSGAQLVLETEDDDKAELLPPLHFHRAGTAYPTVSQRTRLEQDTTSIPTMPKSLELFLIQQPQLEKFSAQSTQHLEQIVQFSRSTNILFTEQVMQAFHIADRRRIHALSLDDVTEFFTRVIREYQRGSLSAERDDRDRVIFDESQYDIRPRALFPNLPGAEQVDDNGRPTILRDSVHLYVTSCANLCGIRILEEDLSLRDFVRLIEFRPSDVDNRGKLFYKILRDYFSWMEKLTPGKELSDASVRPVQPAPQLPTRGNRHR